MKQNITREHSIRNQRRLKWIGHFMNMNKVCPANVSVRWTPAGKCKPERPTEKGRRMVGELKEVGITWKKVEKKAKDGHIWQQLISTLYKDMHKEDY